MRAACIATLHYTDISYMYYIIRTKGVDRRGSGVGSGGKGGVGGLGLECVCVWPYARCTVDRLSSSCVYRAIPAVNISVRVACELFIFASKSVTYDIVMISYVCIRRTTWSIVYYMHTTVRNIVPATSWSMVQRHNNIYYCDHRVYSITTVVSWYAHSIPRRPLAAVWDLSATVHSILHRPRNRTVVPFSFAGVLSPKISRARFIDIR